MLARRPRKKLKDWIRWQLSADGPGPDYCRLCRRKRRSDEPCEPCPEPSIFPENVPAVDFFLSIQTQWRTALGGHVGLDYAGVESAARLLGVDLDRNLFAKLQVLEVSYLEAMGARRAREDAAKPPPPPSRRRR